MATEIKVWQIENGQLEPLETNMVQAGRTEPEHLEQWIKSHPSILGQDLLIIGEQVRTKSGLLDFLGIDRSGNAVIIELKRERIPREALAQAIDYTSDVASWNFDKLSEECERYRDQPLDTYMAASDVFAGVNLEDISVNQTQRILLVGTHVDESLERMIEWLSGNYGVAINALLFKYIKTKSGDELIARTMIIPEEVEQERSRDQQRRRVYRKWEGDIEDHYERLGSRLGDYLKNLVEELDIEPTNLSGSGFHLINGDRRILVSTWQKNKIEFRFARAKKEDVENLLRDLNITSLSVKDKADIESYGLENPTPSVDYKEEYGSFENIKRICRTWLEM
jgi:hypothetical protein